MKTLTRTLLFSASMVTSMLVSTVASASNCYIMVHGHGVKGDNPTSSSQPALDSWQESHFSEYNGASFFDSLLENDDNYAVIGYDSTDDSGYPYWRDETAGEIARQMVAVKQGNGDGYNHPQANTQCSASDDFWVVSHSQGAQQMVFMSGNAISGSPYYNTAFNSAGSAVSVPFDDAFDDVLGIFALGGAMGGTEGSDRVCNGSWVDSLLNVLFVGKDCNDSVKWLQTNDSYLARNLIGTNLAAPLYVMGGYSGFPGMEGVSSGLLTGEDDGYINLASQGACSGSPKRNLWSDFKKYKTFFGIAYGSATYKCDNNNKGTPRTYNMASVYEDHDSERNGGKSSPDYTDIPDGMSCGNGKNMAARIKTCS